ncbi:MAG: tetratricopeptide repeat protein [Acidobacteriota bacterium]|nr:tetratricopeptide repeat protein [Acidobacteriota bacterium]
MTGLVIGVILGTVAAVEPVPTPPSRQAQAYYHFALGTLHSGNKDFGLSKTEFEKALELDPDSIQLRIEYAHILVRSGDVTKAVSEIQQAIRKDPNSVAAHYFLGQLYSSYHGGQSGLSEKAIEKLNKVIELDPDHAEALYQLGNLHRLRGEHRKAAPFLARLVELRPGLVEAHYQHAKNLEELGDLAGAIQALEKALSIQKGHFEVIGDLGRLYVQTGRPDRAVEIYLSAPQLLADPDLLTKTGRLLAQQGRHEQAVELLRKGTSRNVQDPALAVELGRALMRVREFEEATEVFGRVLENNPKQREATLELSRLEAIQGERESATGRLQHLLSALDSPRSRGEWEFREQVQVTLAHVHQESRQYTEAIGLFRELLKGRPGEPRFKAMLIYALKDAGKLDEALSLAGELLHDHPRDPDALATRAQMLSANDRLSEGVELVQSRLSPEKDPETYYRIISQLYMDHKNYRKAENAIKKGLGLKPDSEPLSFRLASVYERQEKLPDAEAEFMRILESNPDHAGVLNYLGYMWADRGIRLQEALTYIRKATEMDPYNGAYLDSLGWVYFKLHRLDEAEVNLKRAAQLTEDPTILDHLGDLYIELGQLETALQYYERGVRVATDEEFHRLQRKVADVKQRLSSQAP